MATETSRLIVELMDKVSEPAKRVASSLAGITRATREQNGLGLSFSGRLDAAMARNERSLSRARVGMVDAAAGFIALRQAIGGPVAAASAFEDAMADVTKVVDFESPEALEEFERRLQNLSSEIPIAVNGLADIAAAAGQSGIAGDELIKFTDAAARIGVAFDISAGEAGESMAKLRTALGLSTDEVILLADSFNHLSNNQASTAAQITDFMKRTAATAETYGFAARESAAFGSAMIASGAEANVAATSFRNMGRNLTKGASATKRVRDGLADIGLEATDVAKRMQEDAVGTTLEVLEKINQLPEEMQAATISNIFGDEARALGPIIGNLDLIRDSLDLVGEDADFAGSSFDEAARRMATFGGAGQTFKNQITQIGIALGDALIPRIKETMEALRPVLTAIRDWIAENPGLAFGAISAPIWIAIAAAVAAIGAAWKYWDRISAIVSGVASAIGEELQPVFEWLGDKLGFLSPLLEPFAAAWRGIGDALSYAWGKIKDFFSGDLFKQENLTDEQFAEIEARAKEAATAIIDWLKQPFVDFFEWISGIGDRIKEAIGSFDLGGIIDWPEPPAWWNKLFGGDEPTSELQAALDKIDEIRSSGPLPTDDAIARLRAEREALEAQIVKVKAREATNRKDQRDKNAELAALRRDLEGVEEKLEETTARADELRAALQTVDEQSAEPEIIDDSIDEAMATVERLEAALNRINNARVSPQAQVAPTAAQSAALTGDESLDGARASGGPITRGGRYLVGEEGAEVITAQRDGYVHPAHRTPAIMSEALSAPEFKAPEFKAPEFKAPAIGLPEFNIPAIEVSVSPRHQDEGSGRSQITMDNGPEVIAAQRDGSDTPKGSSSNQAGATVHFAPQFTFHNTRADDAEQIASQMRDIMRSEVREVFRGVFADTSMRFA